MSLLPYAFAKRQGIVLAADSGAELTAFHLSDVSYHALLEVSRLQGMSVKFSPVNEQKFNELLSQCYQDNAGQSHEAADFLQNGIDLAGLVDRLPEPEDLLDVSDEAPVIRLINALLAEAIRENVSDIHIERIGASGKPHPITPKRIDEGLNTAALFVAGAPMLFAKWARGFQKHTNKLPLFDAATSNAAGGDANIIYHHSHWKLNKDEALVIEVMPPSCDSWNFQLNNYWMESLDYRYFNICISKGNAVYRDDGSVQVIVAHHDPGLPNWIETCGHEEGTMCWRWYRLEEGAEPIEPNCTVKKLEEIRNEQPT